MTLIRMFIAIELGETVKSEIQEVVEELSSRHKNASWVGPSNLHFTMKFLGDVDDSRLGEVITAIEKSLIGFQPFRLQVHGLGYFGSRRFAKVLWVGTHEGREELVKLAAALDSSLSHIRKDERPPSPHITICRPKGETLALIEDVEKMKSRDFGIMDVKSVSLKKSTLTPRGAVYEDVKIFPLSFSLSP